ncbi:MAG: hypothetical protein V1910_01890 [bacterium]
MENQEKNILENLEKERKFSEQVWKIIRKLENKENFFVVGIKDAKVSDLIKFVIDSKLQKEFKILNSKEACIELIKAKYSEENRSNRNIYETEQIWNFIELCNKNNLWEEFEKIERE